MADITPADLIAMNWARISHDPTDTGSLTVYQCREHPRLTMVWERDGRASTTVYSVDGRRITGTVAAMAAALSTPPLGADQEKVSA